MSGGRSSSPGPDAGTERWLRSGTWLALAASWVVAVVAMWGAADLAPAERLAAPELLDVPSGRIFLTAAIFSGFELALVLATLWPRWPDFYATRLAAAALGLLGWLLIVTPVELSRIDRVHRAWLTFLVLAVTASLVLFLTLRLVRRVGRRQTT